MVTASSNIRTRIYLSVLPLFLFSCLSAIAQSQTQYNRLDDFGTGSVQTFIAEETGSYVGVSLVLFGHGTANDMTIYVRELQPDGSLSPVLLTTGFVPASAISTTVAGWHFIQFLSPISVSAGSAYGLVLNQFGSGPTHYDDYGSSTGNPYLNGRMMHEPAPGQPLAPIFPDLDLAFQNVVSVPEPGVFTFGSLGALAFVAFRRTFKSPLSSSHDRILH